MMKSKPVIIAAAIVAAIIGAWAGMNMFNSGIALAMVIGIFAVVGFFIYNGLSRNRSVERLGDAERAALLASPPASSGRVVVYREGFVAKLSGFDIAIDGVLHAQLKSPQSVAIDLPPGDHSLAVRVAGKDQPPFGFALIGGETAVIRIGMGMAGCEISREANLAAAQAKLATIPMVRADSAPRPAASISG